jgi:uncharacterized membrane protein YgcG
MKLVGPVLVVLWVVLAAAPRAGAAPRSREGEAEAEMLKAKQALERAQYDVAIGHLLVARSLAPEASGPYLNLGIAYERLGRCADAVPMLEEYLRRKPKSPHPSAATTLAACRAAAKPAPSEAPATAAPTDSDDGPEAPRRAAPPAAAVVATPPALAPPELVAPPPQPSTNVLVESPPDVTVKKKRVWPTVVGVLAGVAVAGAIVAIVVTQVPSSSHDGGNGGGGSGGGGSGGMGGGATEVGFPTGSTR